MSKDQLTLGKLIYYLGSLPTGTQVVNLINPHSHQVYSDELAFEPGKDLIPVERLITVCKEIIFSWYKDSRGGYHLISESTPVWVAKKGEIGKMIMAVNENGEFITQLKER